ncbi:MAG: hypothetical protein ILP16_12545 [Spirochaetales bacterium]|nr:hypothetical protein [Spirochaetales bacterium]
MKKAFFVVLSIFLVIGLLVSCEEPGMSNGAGEDNASPNPEGGGNTYSVEAFFSRPEILAAFSMEQEDGAVPVVASIGDILGSGSGFHYPGFLSYCAEGVSESFSFTDPNLSGHSGSNLRIYESAGYSSVELDIKDNSTLEVKHYKKVEEWLSDEHGAPLEDFLSVEYGDEKVEKRVTYGPGAAVTWKLNGNAVAENDPNLEAITNDPSSFYSFSTSVDVITEGSVRQCNVDDFGNADSNPTVVAHVVTAVTTTAAGSTTVATATVTDGANTLTVKGYASIDTDGDDILDPGEWVTGDPGIFQWHILKIELNGVLYDCSDLSALNP